MDAQWNKRHIGSGIPKKQFSRKWTRARRSLRSIARCRKLSTAILSGENRAVAKKNTLNISEWICISHLYLQGLFTLCFDAVEFCARPNQQCLVNGCGAVDG